jgi:hypothetical protein
MLITPNDIRYIYIKTNYFYDISSASVMTCQESFCLAQRIPAKSQETLGVL